MVRVPSNASEYVSRVLDGGALGVIAPHIGSAEEARAVVKAPAAIPAAPPPMIATSVLPMVTRRSATVEFRSPRRFLP
jgi:2-keto-3-deoxy-L-rhamnonate aldolase RhmA